MLKLSMEIPTGYLHRWSPLVDFDFVLAHKVLADPNYAEFFKLRSAGRDVLLDNSTHEFGRPIPFDDLQRAARTVDATWVIAPDIVNPSIDSLQVQQNITWAETACMELDDQFGVAGVLCGNDDHELDEWLNRCVTAGISMLCFTFHNPDRLKWWQHFEGHSTFDIIDRVHILGLLSLEELRHWVSISEEHPTITFSFDTSKALSLGVQGVLMSTLSDEQNLRGGKIKSKEVLEMQTFSTEQMECVEENIYFLRKVCRNEA